MTQLYRDPVAGSSFGDLPGPLLKAATFDKIKKSPDLANWITANVETKVNYSSLLDAYSNVCESQTDFRTRAAQTARELRDEAVADLKTRLGKQAKFINDDLDDALAKVQAEKSQANSALLTAAVGVGASLLSGFFGHKSNPLTVTNINKAGTAWKQRSARSRSKILMRSSKPRHRKLKTNTTRPTSR